MLHPSPAKPRHEPSTQHRPCPHSSSPPPPCPLTTLFNLFTSLVDPHSIAMEFNFSTWVLTHANEWWSRRTKCDVWWELAPPCMIETFTTATETMVPNSSSSNSRDDRQLNIRTSSSSSTFPISWWCPETEVRVRGPQGSLRWYNVLHYQHDSVYWAKFSQ